MNGCHLKISVETEKKTLLCSPNIWPSQICHWKWGQVQKAFSGITVSLLVGRKTTLLRTAKPPQSQPATRLCPFASMSLLQPEESASCLGWSSLPSAVLQESERKQFLNPDDSQCIPKTQATCLPLCLLILGGTHLFLQRSL